MGAFFSTFFGLCIEVVAFMWTVSERSATTQPLLAFGREGSGGFFLASGLHEFHVDGKRSMKLPCRFRPIDRPCRPKVNAMRVDGAFFFLASGLQKRIIEVSVMFT